MKRIVKAKNKEELEKIIEKVITLADNEEIDVRVIKDPKKILFFSFDGEYEVTIREKSNKNIEKIFNTKKVAKEPKKLKEDKIEEFEETIKTSNSLDENVEEKLIKITEEFIEKSKLDVHCVGVRKEKGFYIVEIDGKDVRFLIGEKGITLNSLEYLLMTLDQFKNIRISVDSNNYKKKREESLRELARKKVEKVKEINKPVKLNPMSARERKIIHEEVSKIRGFRTESVGIEPKRYLVIRKERGSK